MFTSRILGNLCSKTDSQPLSEVLLAEGILKNMATILNLIHTETTENQQELFDNILIVLGNLLNCSQATRLRIFETNVMDQALDTFPVYRKSIEVAETMAWLISNTLNPKYQLTDYLQFVLFDLLTNIYEQHKSEDIFKEWVWSMKFLLARESNISQRILCIDKSRIISTIIKQIQKTLASSSPSWIKLGFEGLAEFIAKAGSAYCTPDFVEVA